ncbi:bifunctional hydroxymethylpyrimidine kinase/phosphomethylpyrimidine kinase [Vibrio marisflavi]|uniref:hydroxymethylpyrimidine kinase n=1 Tax=Vibrio marisflavi CECT 7928 TaxID=634439 RepID=A0ABN8DZG3_9VIBR|nr:bifunctional hydroxymethylpyrimidine kinase/phosphomethylpyrimidine kinase [Vibrio marisflavi]CAH0535861.1 Hydroxymethylpyrimidine/phosphomethylpyrimidine kinase [Vibrio marisflavi CECT 7928]
MNQPSSSSSTPIVLTIAGSDSGGGAGIQADIKTISATGSYACSAITAITAQNTLGVSAVFPTPYEQVRAQLEAVFSDMPLAAVKIGMLANASIIGVVSEVLRKYAPEFVVLDPVLVSSSGVPLLEANAISMLKEQLIPHVTLLTPNLPESMLLTGRDCTESEEDILQLGEALTQLGAKAALLKGGHMSDKHKSADWLFYNGKSEQFSSARVVTKNSHGTGCTLSSAIASYSAQGYKMNDAIQLAKRYIFQALASSDKLNVGKGVGPLNHFHMLDV